MQGRTMKETCVILADKHPNMLEGIRGILEAEFDNVVMVAERRSLKNAVKKFRTPYLWEESETPQPCHFLLPIIFTHKFISHAHVGARIADFGCVEFIEKLCKCFIGSRP